MTKEGETAQHFKKIYLTIEEQRFSIQHIFRALVCCKGLGHKITSPWITISLFSLCLTKPICISLHSHLEMENPCVAHFLRIVRENEDCIRTRVRALGVEKSVLEPLPLNSHSLKKRNPHPGEESEKMKWRFRSVVPSGEGRLGDRKGLEHLGAY